MAYIFDPIRNTFIDDEDKSLGNKLALLDPDLENAIRQIGEKFGPDTIKTLDQLPENKPEDVKLREEFNRFNKMYEDGGRVNLQNGTDVLTLNPLFPEKNIDPMSDEFKPLDVPGGFVLPASIGVGANRLKDIFFSKDKSDDKKEIISSNDEDSNIEPPKGPKFELKDVLTESIFESMRDPENRNKVKSIVNEQVNFFKKKNVDKKTTEKFIKSVENKAITLPGQQNYKQPVFNKDYLTLFKSYVDQNHGGNLSKAIAELDINVSRRTVQRRFQETNMGTFKGAGAEALLDIEPGTSTYTEVMETMKSNPKNIFSDINLKIKKGNLSKKSYVESIDLANLLGIDGTDPEQRNQFLKRLRKLNIRTKAGTQGGKAKKYHLGDTLNELSFYTKNERQALAGNAEDYVALRKKREINLGLDKINSTLRRNITSRLENTDIAIPKISLAEDMGHAESLELIEKYPNLFKGSNVKSLQTLVRQDPVINQRILVDNGYHSKNDAIYKQLKSKKISISEANNLLKLNNERIKSIIINEAKNNPYFKNQENRIPLLQIDKKGVVQADMSTVDPFYIYGNIDKINPKANQVSDLSKKQINVYLNNLKSQWTDGAVKFLNNLKDESGIKIYSDEEIKNFEDFIMLKSDKKSKYNFKKGGPVELSPMPRFNFSNGGAAGADDDFAKELEYYFLNEDAELPKATSYRETMNPVEALNDMIDPRNYPYYADLLVRSGLRVGEFGVRILPALGKLGSDLLTKPAFRVTGTKKTGYVQDYEDIPGTGVGLAEGLKLEGTGIFQDFLKNITPTSLEKKVGLEKLIEAEEQKQKDRRSTIAPKVLGETISLGAEVTAPIFPGLRLLRAFAADRKLPVDNVTKDIMEKEIDEVLDARGIGRRDFMKVAGAGGSVMLAKMLGVSLETAPKVAEKVASTGSGAPPYFFRLVDKIRALGRSGPGTKDRSESFVYGDYEMEIDYDTGAIDIKRTEQGMFGDEIAPVEEVNMFYRPGKADETTGGKVPPDEYEEFTARPDEDGKMKDVEDGVPDDVVDEGSISKEELEQLIIRNLANE